MKKPALRFKGFDGEWVDESLDQLCLQIGDIDHRMPESVECGIPYIMTGDFSGLNDIDFNHAKLISKSDYDLLSKKIKPEKHDIIFARYASIGATRLVKQNRPFLVSYSCVIIKLKNKEHADFINASFYAPYLKRQEILAMNTGSQANVGIDSLKKFRIYLPSSTKEKKAIGSFFTELDSLIEGKRVKLDKLKKLKLAYLSKMFPKKGSRVPEVRFKGFTGDWEEKTLGSIAEIVGGGTPSTSNPDYWNGSIDWFSPTEIGESPYAECSRKKLTQKGFDNCSANMLPALKTILFTSRAGIGDAAILKVDACTNQGFQSIVLKDGIDTYFIYSMTPQIKDFALIHASGSTFLEISGKVLASMPILHPSLPEQQKIGAFFQNLDNLINLQQQELDKLSNIKSACLSKMFA